MLKLNLSNKPVWLDLGHDVRLQLLPLTTALMVAARNDPAIANLDEDTGDEESALVFAKALGRLAIIDWEGVGDKNGDPVAVSPEGIDALLDVWPLFEVFQTEYIAGGLLLDQEKTSRRSCRMVLRWGRRILPGLHRNLQNLPANPE